MRFAFKKGLQVFVINSSQDFQAINLKLCTDDISILKVCMLLFSGKKMIFGTITEFCTETILRLGLQYGVASLCNQLFPEFSSNQFETLHRCYKHIGDVYVTFCMRENNF